MIGIISNAAGFSLALLLISFGVNSGDRKIAHKVEVIHPGKDVKEPEETILFERINESGETLEFFVNVESVICAEGLCKIVPVAIFWNEFGMYERIELEEFAYLEKYEGEEFTKEDYLKLDTILKNKNSSLADYDIDELINKGKKSKQDPDVDAVSGATIISISKSETVVGATLTCYTLWHWANGDLTQIIRDISVPKIPESELVKLLNVTDVRQTIAVDELARREVFRTDVSEIVVDNISAKNVAFRRKAFAYIEALPRAQHFEAISNIFRTKEDRVRLKALFLVDKTPYDVPEEFALFLSRNIVEKANHIELGKMLDIFEERNIQFASSNKEFLKLLNSEDFSIAHRSYLYLKDKVQSEEDKRSIEKIFEEHKNTIEKRGGWSIFGKPGRG